MDPIGDMGTCRRESLHKEGYRAGSVTSQEIGTVHPGFPQGRQATAGEDVSRGSGESVDLGPPLPREAWRRMRGWYREAVNHALPPSRVTLERITVEQKELYRSVPPSAETIPISVPTSPIDDSVPTDEEVEGAVRRLRGHQSGGPYYMRAEHLREWLREHRSEEAAKVKAKATEAEAEAEGETSGSERNVGVRGEGERS